MKHFNLALVFLLSLIALTYGQTSQSGKDAKSGLVDCGARFNSFSGQVEVRQGANANAWKAAQPGMVLYGNDHIRTGTGSSAILSFYGGNTLAAKAKTEFIIPSPGGKVGQLILMNGTIMAEVKPPNNDGALLIDLNYAVVGFKVGTVILESSDEGATLKVIEGKIILNSKANGKSVEVSNGQFVRATPQGASTPAQVDLTLDKLEWSHFKTIAEQNLVGQIKKSAPPTENTYSPPFEININGYVLSAICLLIFGVVMVLKRRKRNRRTGSPSVISQNPPSPAIMTCRNCGNPLPEQTKFCIKCGEKVMSEVQPPSNQVVTTNLCKSCGTVITPGVKFCISCGTPVSNIATLPQDRRMHPPIVQPNRHVAQPQIGQRPAKKKGLVLLNILVSVVVILCLSFVGLYFSGTYDPAPNSSLAALYENEKVDKVQIESAANIVETAFVQGDTASLAKILSPSSLEQKRPFFKELQPMMASFGKDFKTRKLLYATDRYAVYEFTSAKGKFTAEFCLGDGGKWNLMQF
jgi:hypothetical protein